MNARTVLPRGILAIRASHDDGDLVTMLQGINTEVKDFKDRYGAEIDRLNVKLAAQGMNGGGSGPENFVPPEPEYTASFLEWVRDGRDESTLRDAQRDGVRATIQASMSVGNPGSGGYLAPVEWDRQIVSALLPLSPMRRLARVVSTVVGGYTTLWNAKGWTSGWVGEETARPKTDSMAIAPLEFTHGEIYANPAITQRLLDDADYPLEEFIASEIAEEFSKQESIAFINGNGVNKPRGLLTYVEGGANASVHPGGTLMVVFSGEENGIGTPDSLIDFVYGLPSPYRRNASWLMNSLTAARFAKLKDGEGRYLWQQSYVAGQPSTLLGYPVEIDENMPDVAPEALAVAFGDFATGYIINDRVGVRMLRDPYTNKPFVHFYAAKRVGGGVRDPNAIRLLAIGLPGGDE